MKIACQGDKRLDNKIILEHSDLKALKVRIGKVKKFLDSDFHDERNRNREHLFGDQDQVVQQKEVERIGNESLIRKQQRAKQVKKFNKTLTSKKMMQADIMPELNYRK